MLYIRGALWRHWFSAQLSSRYRKKRRFCKKENSGAVSAVCDSGSAGEIVVGLGIKKFQHSLTAPNSL